jgi:hypothetical protein
MCEEQTCINDQAAGYGPSVIDMKYCRARSRVKGGAFNQGKVEVRIKKQRPPVMQLIFDFTIVQTIRDLMAVKKRNHVLDAEGGIEYPGRLT